MARHQQSIAMQFFVEPGFSGKIKPILFYFWTAKRWFWSLSFAVDYVSPSLPIRRKLEFMGNRCFVILELFSWVVLFSCGNNFFEKTFEKKNPKGWLHPTPRTMYHSPGKLLSHPCTRNITTNTISWEFVSLRVESWTDSPFTNQSLCTEKSFATRCRCLFFFHCAVSLSLSLSLPLSLPCNVSSLGRWGS